MTQYIKPNIGGLNTSHPLYANLQAFLEFGQLDKELVSDTALTTTAALVDDVDIGDARTFDNTADAVAETVAVSGDITILVIARLTAGRALGTNGNIMFVNREASGNNISFQYEAFSPYKYRSINRANFSSTIVVNADGFANDDIFNDGHAVAFTYDLGGTNKSCIDGVIGAESAAAPAGPYAGSPALNFMTSIGSGASVNVGGIAIFNKALSDAELQSVTNDPWDLVIEPVTLTCDSITGGTIRAGDTVTIQLSNATNASGKTLSIPQGSITPSAQDINSISFVAPDFKTFGDKTGVYGVNTAITVTDGAESDTIDFQLSPDVGDEVGAITAVEGIYAEPEFTGVVVTDVYYTTTISGADFTVGAVPVLGTEQTFNLWIQDQTDGVWGSPFVVTIPASSSGIPAASRTDVWKIGRYLQSTGTYNSEGVNEIVMEWLIAEGIGRSQLNYMLYLYLEGLGYAGTLNDKLRKWSLDP